MLEILENLPFSLLNLLDVIHYIHVYGLAHEIFVHIANAQKPHFHAHDDVTSWDGSLNFDLSTHRHPFVVYASHEGSGESAHMRRFA